MNHLFVLHVAAFSLSTVACFGSIGRALAVSHSEVRRGLVALLVSSGIWAGANTAYLVAPSTPLRRAFYVLGLVFGLVAVGAWLSFAAVYTGRSVKKLPLRRSVAGLLLGLILLKVTNPIHQLYFTASPALEPFPHLAVQHGVLHWTALGLAYALSFVGFFMLLEFFQRAGTETRPLVLLMLLTALPVGFNVVGAFTPWLLEMTYEPIGVAGFAVGVLFLYSERFQRIHVAGETEEPVISLGQERRVRDYNRRAAELFPEISGSLGEPLESVIPELAESLGNESNRVEVERNGETRHYHVASNPIMVGSTETGRSLVVSDVTEAERYRQLLEKRNEQLDALNRVVRHDIRNDMTVILGWGDTLRESLDESGEEALDRVLRTAQHTVDLTKTARDFVDSLAGEEAELKHVGLGEKLENEVATVRDLYPDADVRIEGEIPTVDVEADDMLSSVIRNLLNNAVQHNDKETPEIQVSVAEGSETVELSIADNGPGVPGPQKETIFGKGEKGLDSEGTGIGLYLVHTLVDHYGGEVRVEDNQPRGAVFKVELKKAEGKEETGE